MSDGEYKKLRRHINLLTIAVIALILLGIASFIHKSINPKTTSFPKIQVVNGKDGKDGTTPQIDYGRIDAYIQAQVANLPKPQNGAPGQVGPQGIPGIGIQGPAGQNGSQGEPGAAGRELIIRYNPLKEETEYQYSGDLTWQVLVKNCQIQGTC